MGVEDNETFAWQIAEKFPDVQFVNEGLPAYNAENNRRVIASSKADGIILIHIHNDDFPLSSFEPQSGERRGALELYLYYLSIEKRNTDYPRDTAAYNAAMDAINEHDNVLTVAFDNDNLLNDDSVARLPLWTTYVSGADFHPDANGHEEITANLLPIVETFVDSICG
jgi:hypothetical protein